MIAALKGFAEDRLSLEEAIDLSAQAGIVANEFEAQCVPVPDWLVDAQERLQRSINNARRDALENELAEIKRQQESLKTPAEKRRDLAARQKDIEAALA